MNFLLTLSLSLSLSLSLLTPGACFMTPHSFAVRSRGTHVSRGSVSSLKAMEMPPPQSDSTVTSAQVSLVTQTQSTLAPQNIRYSDFLKSVNSNTYEKVTFSSDGTKLLAVDVDGNRVKIDQVSLV